MATRQKNPQQDFAISSEPDELSAPSGGIVKGKRPASAPGTTTPGFSGPAPGSPKSDPAPKSIPASERTPAITYTKADLQQLLQICIGVKKAL